MKLLQGFRGQATVDIDTLLDTLIRTAQMAHALSDRLVEMDINPLMITPKRCIAADALIHLGE